MRMSLDNKDLTINFWKDIWIITWIMQDAEHRWNQVSPIPLQKHWEVQFNNIETRNIIAKTDKFGYEAYSFHLGMTGNFPNQKHQHVKQDLITAD